MTLLVYLAVLYLTQRVQLGISSKEGDLMISKQCQWQHKVTNLFPNLSCQTMKSLRAGGCYYHKLWLLRTCSLTYLLSRCSQLQELLLENVTPKASDHYEDSYIPSTAGKRRYHIVLHRSGTYFTIWVQVTRL